MTFWETNSNDANQLVDRLGSFKTFSTKGEICQFGGGDRDDADRAVVHADVSLVVGGKVTEVEKFGVAGVGGTACRRRHDARGVQVAPDAVLVDLQFHLEGQDCRK